MEPFNGMGLGLHNISRLSDAVTRSISAENFDGSKGSGGMAMPPRGPNGQPMGAARELGQGWKVSPCISLQPRATVGVEIEGPGAIQHIWITCHPDWWRRLVLRVYWDGEETPSIETPLGDFFCMGWCQRANVNSLPIAVNPAGGFNSYWEMPFRRSARITVENLWDETLHGFFFQVTYALTSVPDDCAYLHAQWRRSNPVPYGEVHTLLDGVKGRGHYVGTYLAWQSNSCGWWGEGEAKFYLDGDTDFPTICGTGTEDYFGGAWNFEHPAGQYGVYSTAFLGLPQVITASAEGMYRSQQRFGMYRWHVLDPIRFQNDIRVTIQALGWRSGGRYLALQDDLASTALWYQAEPHAPYPALPDRNGLEVI
ncbi:MAG TPA: glycoside hydrolase family 172 protein [Chthonomonadales bacterium]|nr:glycoside hydrolase family 172 protein [Chthonomonadales bacterium]